MIPCISIHPLFRSMKILDILICPKDGKIFVNMLESYRKSSTYLENTCLLMLQNMGFYLFISVISCIIIHIPYIFGKDMNKIDMKIIDNHYTYSLYSSIIDMNKIWPIRCPIRWPGPPIGSPGHSPSLGPLVHRAATASGRHCPPGRRRGGVKRMGKLMKWLVDVGGISRFFKM